MLFCVGSPAAALLVWAFGALIHLCGLLIWLEFGLTVPRRKIPSDDGDDDDVEYSVPAQGGEKNYVGFLRSFFIVSG